MTDLAEAERIAQEWLQSVEGLLFVDDRYARTLTDAIFVALARAREEEREKISQLLEFLRHAKEIYMTGSSNHGSEVHIRFEGHVNGIYDNQWCDKLERALKRARAAATRDEPEET